MKTINERFAIKNDEKIEIEFPVIKTDEVPLLLIYEASEELHKAGLKAKIVTFLYDNKAIEIESHINSSIYFKLKEPYSMAVIKKLSKDFESNMTLIEKEYGGKIFWTFNYLVKFAPKDKPQRIGIVGQANKTFYDKFNDKLILLINILILRKNP